MKYITPFLWIAAVYLSQVGLASTDLWRWQNAVLYWNYMGHILFFIPPIVGLIVSRKRVGAYGLRFDGIYASAKIGLYFAVPLIAFPVIADALFGSLSVRPAIQGRALQTAFYMFVMVGIAEELLFRGYLQGELNACFTKRRRFLGASITPAFWIAVVVFTACHFIPGLYIPPLWETVYIFAAAVLFGLLREWTQSLAAPILAHFALNLHRNLFGMSLPAAIATGVAWFIGFWLLAQTLTRKQSAPTI